MKGRVKAISISNEKGLQKKNVPSAVLRENFGIEGDTHAGNWHRQVSLLAIESINKIKKKLSGIKPGAFAENITTEGINLTGLQIGTTLKIGKDVLLEISQIGKECHSPCMIYREIGACVMPKEGIFARVIKGGVITEDDKISV